VKRPNRQTAKQPNNQTGKQPTFVAISVLLVRALFSVCHRCCHCCWRVNKYNIADCTICTTRVYLYCIYISCWAAAPGLRIQDSAGFGRIPAMAVRKSQKYFRSLAEMRKIFQLGERRRGLRLCHAILMPNIIRK